jgi:hypothetical protein
VVVRIRFDSLANSAKIRMLAKKEIEIDSMPNKDVVYELKQLAIPPYGTVAERKERLKKHFGM